MNVPEAAIVAITQFDRLPIPAGILTLDGTVVGVNAAGQALLGRNSRELVGRKAWDFAPGADLIWEELLAGARVKGRELGEISIATPQEPRRVCYVLSLREWEGATYVLMFGLELRDETSAELEAQHRLEALGLIAGGIAHDFNNQLVSVLAEASGTRDDPMLGENSREALRRIEAAAHRMSQLTRQLLAYAGRGGFVPEIIDADELVSEMKEQLARLVRSDATFTIAPGAGRVAIEADTSLLRQVMTNLVVNASESLAPSGGRITVTTRQVTRPDGVAQWTFEVSDNGTGMDARTIARMFDPFFTTKADRHGLGLSAVQGIVRRLGGEILVDSKVGEGTTIGVRLPILPGIEPERQRSTTRPQPLVTLEGLRILIADDEPSVRTTVRRLLERRGAQIVIAADGAEARALLSEGRYDLVLFDVMMPQLTGYQLVPIARELQPAAKVVLMSGFAELPSGTAAGAEPDAFIEKPFTAKQLDQTIDDLFGTR